MFTDIHAHILHNIDDGPEKIEDSLELLKLSAREGCNQIIATPHFYAAHHDLQERIDLALARFNELKTAVQNAKINIELLQGYEVRYFQGISRSENIGSFCLNNSKFLLLELGPEEITDKIISEILELNYSGFVVILAHIERYYKFGGFKKLKQLIQNKVALAQVNATSFLVGPFTRVSAQLLKSNLVSFVAGDMHSVVHRPPDMAAAFDVIGKKYGQTYVSKLIENSNELFDIIK